VQTKRDQLQAHNFVAGRLKAALLRGDADALETPTRRFSAAAFAGVLVAALLVAGFAVFGFILPGGNRGWREPGSIIVEKETGTRYLFLDGVLRPVPNLASARLVVGVDGRIRSVSERSLRGVPHGLPVGIAGAPDALPQPARMTREPWLVCVHGAGSVTVLVGASAGAGVGADAAVAVAGPDGTSYLVWRDRRWRVRDRSGLVAFGFAGVRPLPVTTRWLDALPPGAEVRAPHVAQRGQPGLPVDGHPTRVGQVFAVRTNDGTDFYLLLADGLVPLSPAATALVLADPDSRAGYGDQPVQPVPVGADVVVTAPHSATALDMDLPAVPPRPFDVDGRALCVRRTVGAGSGPPVQVVLTAPPATGDRVVVPPGSGLLARAGQAVYLITDLGLKYPLPSQAAATALGYADVTAVDVPAVLLALLPTGPVLDPSRAGATLLTGT
jgi:type VII secretion protein EccB